MSASAPRIQEGIITLRLPEPNLEDLVRYCTDLHKVLEEALTEVADRSNFAGQQRAQGGRVYRYDEATGLWLSDSRATFTAGLAVLVNSSINNLPEHGVTSSGYLVPQSAVLVRWGWDWAGNSVSGDSVRLLLSSTTLKTTTLGVVSSLHEELLPLGLTIPAGERIRFAYNATGAAPQNAVAWVELAWTQTFGD